MSSLIAELQKLTPQPGAMQPGQPTLLQRLLAGDYGGGGNGTFMNSGQSPSGASSTPTAAPPSSNPYDVNTAPQPARTY